MKFELDKAVSEIGVRGVYFSIIGMTNRPSDDPSVKRFVDERVKKTDDFDRLEKAKGFNLLHEKVSNRPDKVTASSVALVKLWQEHGNIPRINGIVDVYNAISFSSMLAVGAHDLSHVVGNITLRIVDGSERFWPLGSPKQAKVPKGEYCYVDDSNDVLCRLEVRQVEKTKITIGSRNVFYIVQGHSGFSQEKISSYASELIQVSTRLFGGELISLHPQGWHPSAN